MKVLSVENPELSKVLPYSFFMLRLLPGVLPLYVIVPSQFTLLHFFLVLFRHTLSDMEKTFTCNLIFLFFLLSFI